MQTREQVKNWKVVASAATVVALGVSGLAVASPSEPTETPPPIEIEDTRTNPGVSFPTQDVPEFQVQPSPTIDLDDSLDSPLASADLDDASDSSPDVQSSDLQDSPDSSPAVNRAEDSPDSPDSPDVDDSPETAESPDVQDSPADSPDVQDSVDSLDS